LKDGEETVSNSNFLMDIATTDVREHRKEMISFFSKIRKIFGRK
jgi:hypothetical protein